MCFSATSSFASAAAVGVVGLATLPKIRTWHEVLLGSLPLLFAAHQFEEGFVWLALEGRVAGEIGWWCAWLYIIFAHALLMAIAPLSVWLVEPQKRNWRWLLLFVVCGSALAAMALWRLSQAPLVAVLRHHGVEYEDAVTGPWWFAVVYVIVTCVPPFLSSYPWMMPFAVANILGLIAATLFKQIYFTSVWCAIAALISMLVYVHFVFVRRQPILQTAG